LILGAGVLDSIVAGSINHKSCSFLGVQQVALPITREKFMRCSDFYPRHGRLPISGNCGLENIFFSKKQTLSKMKMITEDQNQHIMFEMAHSSETPNCGLEKI